MKTPLFLLALVLAGSNVHGQEKVIPQLAAPQAQYDAKIKSDVLDAYQKDFDSLVSKYRNELNRELSSTPGKVTLEDAVALKAELKLTEGDKFPPRLDDPDLSPRIKKLRDIFRAELDRLEQEREGRWQPYREEYAKTLDPLVAVIEKEGSVEDALAVKSMIEGLRSPAIKIVGAWNTELTDGTKAVWRFGKDFTFTNGNLHGVFTYKNGRYTIHRLFDWEISLLDDNTLEGICTKGKPGLLVHGKRNK